ncbi:Uncharacterised protein [Klebsiella quasivariicola]|uniref:Uncharacterized protein n=1 Tax=Klebsiella quasivariicola TaxID=2026240 RepID=A0ABY6WZ15_9ENTR|nr:Uncharacterised protein [Klebsiella quasivariicola]
MRQTICRAGAINLHAEEKHIKSRLRLNGSQRNVFDELRHADAHSVGHRLHCSRNSLTQLLTQLFHRDNAFARHLLNRYRRALQDFRITTKLSYGVNQSI